MVRKDLLASKDINLRFQREAEAARRVRSPHVATVLDAGYDHGRAYLAVVFVEGPTLQKAVTETGSLSLATLIELAFGLAMAAEAMHTVGLVHRDLTPRNILLTHAGPCAIDVGIASLQEVPGLTATNVVIGTPGYIAPERLQYGQTTPAGDMFSIGALLLYAATGREPFGTGTPMGVNYRAATSSPDLAGIPSPLLDLVEPCLATDPRARPTPQRLIELALATRLRAIARPPLQSTAGPVMRSMPPAVVANPKRHVPPLGSPAATTFIDSGCRRTLCVRRHS